MAVVRVTRVTPIENCWRNAVADWLRRNQSLYDCLDDGQVIERVYGQVLGKWSVVVVPLQNNKKNLAFIVSSVTMNTLIQRSNNKQHANSFGEELRNPLNDNSIVFCIRRKTIKNIRWSMVNNSMPTTIQIVVHNHQPIVIKWHTSGVPTIRDAIPSSILSRIDFFVIFLTLIILTNIT